MQSFYAQNEMKKENGNGRMDRHIRPFSQIRYRSGKFYIIS